MAHEHQVGEGASPGRDRRKRDLRRELRGVEVGEATMAGVVVLVAVAVVLAGVAVGVITAVAIAVRREDRRCTLTFDAPDRLSRNTRRLTGVGCRDLDPELLQPLSGLVR